MEAFLCVFFIRVVSVEAFGERKAHHRFLGEKPVNPVNPVDIYTLIRKDLSDAHARSP
ncbi:MAG: hypothetical protein KF734_20645 [Saprospiraceae bacterium]|nr:hypothetical protein [Saprospiraceae bacterium]